MTTITCVCVTVCVCVVMVQVRVLRLMRILGKGDEDASEMMNDILAQVHVYTPHSFTHSLTH